MERILKLTQTRLGILLLDKSTSGLLKSIPVYAEMSVTVQLPPYSINDEIEFTEQETPLRNWFSSHSFILALIKQIISGNISEKDYKAIADKHSFFAGILQKIKDNLDDNESAANKKAVVEKVVFATLRKLELQTIDQPNLTTLYSFPLGTLASDHAGYLSYDLTGAAGQYKNLLEDKSLVVSGFTFFIYPYGREELKKDITEQSRFTPDVIFGKLFIDKQDFIGKNKVNLPSMQKPGLEDWYLSPGSFAINPAFFIGADGCENLYPANFATQEFRFFQMVRGTKILRNSTGQLDPDRGLEVMTGYSLEYLTSWQPLGHTIGQIVYSLPLAPGEIVKIAVIDWSRKAVDSRNEDLKVSEQLIHNTHRDRNISETVDAAMHEWQRGGSFMAGVAGSYGGAGYGISGAMGGGYSTSSGDRNVHASTVQQISDAFAQASSSTRELRSTIVVQSDQQEHAKAEGRVVANHNHSHALTMLYYEVLRHYKVTTQFMRLRPTIMVEYPDINFKEILIIAQYRKILETVLIEDRFLSCFDAVQKFICLSNELARKVAIAKLSPDMNDINELGEIKLVIKTKKETGKDAFVNIVTKNKETIPCEVLEPDWIGWLKPASLFGSLPNSVSDGSANLVSNNYRQDGETNVFKIKPVKKVVWSDVDGFLITVGPNGPQDWEIETFEAIAIQGTKTWIMFNSVQGATPPTAIVAPNNRQKFLPIQPYKEIPTNAEDLLTEDERCCINKIKAHLSDNAFHYKKAIWMMEDPNERAKRFKSKKTAEGMLLDIIDNRPLDVYGDYVVFPAIRFFENSEALNSIGKVQAEKLMTLPTRGVFGEAKLGHCNASEEIDNTKFWDWQISPITEDAPGIDNLNINASRNATPNLTPTQLPSSIVNIVNPSALPDPTGMANAMNLLGKADIFRDMSVSKEVEDLLKNLASNSVSMGQASNKAGSILQQRANSGSGNGGSINSGGSTTPKPTANEQHDQLQVLRNASDKGDITPEQKNQLAQDYLENATKPKSTLAFGIDAGTADAAAGSSTGVQKELPPVPAPSPIAFLPVNNMPGPSQHPPIMATCPANEFFGDPPTRNQKTVGTVLAPAEISKRKGEIIAAIALAKADRPISANNLQHWFDGTGAELVLPATDFKKVDSEVPTFLHNTARNKFEAGCLARLKDKNHPQGTLLPVIKTVGSKGPIRFLQYRDGVRPSATATPLSKDLFTALGSFNVHSAIWVQATFKGTSGGAAGFFTDDNYEVEILRWCVQIYDVYDWNLSAATPFLLTDQQLKTLPLPAGAVTVQKVGVDANMVLMKDNYFRDLEVSGTGRAFLIRSDAFEAPSGAMGKFNFKF